MQYMYDIYIYIYYIFYRIYVYAVVCVNVYLLTA